MFTLPSHDPNWNASYETWGTIPETLCASSSVSSTNASSWNVSFATPTVVSVWTTSVPALGQLVTKSLMTWAEKLPVILYLEGCYNYPSWWWESADCASNEVQPMIDFKYDDDPGCEHGEQWCTCTSPLWRADWRVGREMSDAEFQEWMETDTRGHAHPLEPAPKPVPPSWRGHPVLTDNVHELAPGCCDNRPEPQPFHILPFRSGGS